MKRLVIAGLLLAAAMNAHAEFVKYHEDEESLSYLDPASITRTGHEARMWTLEDYRQPQKDLEGRKPFLSVKTQWVFDCAKRMSDVLIAFYYAEAMAQGEEVHSGAINERHWDRVEPGSVGELAFRAACAAGVPKAPPPAPARSNAGG